MQCSAEYCGQHRFTDSNGNYKDIPKLIQNVTEAEKSENGTIGCFLNPNRPESGAYVALNDAVEESESRMFRYYEGWIILVAPFVVLLAIILALLIMFLRGDLAAPPIQKPKESFGKSAVCSGSLCMVLHVL